MVGIIIGIVFIGIAIGCFCGKCSAQSRLEQLAAASKQNLSELIPILEQTKAEMSDLGADNVISEKVSVMGQPQCANPLISPIGKVPCIYYRYKVTNKWTERYQERDSNGQMRTQTRTHEDTLDEGSSSTVFTLNDGGTSIEVNPDKGNFEDLVKTVERSETQFNNNNGPSIQIGGLSINLGNSSNMSGYGNMMSSAKYNRPEMIKYKEEIIGLDRRLTIVGTVCDRMGKLCIESTKDNPVIITTKSSDELVADAKSSISGYNIAWIICAIIGIISIIIGI